MRRPWITLARAYGVQATYTDGHGRRVTAPTEALFAVLRALGGDVGDPPDLDDALRRRKQELWRRVLQPVAVAWDADSTALALRLPEAGLARRGVCRITLEDGSVVERSLAPRALPQTAADDVEGRRFVERRIDLPGPWPRGYHRVELEIGSVRAAGWIIAAPRRAYGPAPSNAEPRWGVVAPLHALRSAHDWGVGDFSDLGRLSSWCAVQGGALTCTLPLLAAFVDAPFEPSPYRPVSRLFWNELYLAVAAVPELQSNRGAGALIRSAPWRREIERLRAMREVDLRAVARAKRRVLERLSARICSRRSRRRDAFLSFLRERPEVRDYARFRAATERLGAWPGWPARLRDGTLRAADVEPATERYHAYVQWLAAEQLDQAAREARAAHHGLGLDLPLGVHPDGYDAWRERGIHALEAESGAPPDATFTLGQGWGCPPLHPERSREQGHRYLRDCLAHHMRAASLLRIDHVMSLHRLFWIPRGFEPGHGVYVRYPHEELYATICLESQRHRCRIVAEDLGVVPPQVRPALRRHNMRRTFVLQMAAQPGRRRPLEDLDIEGLAALNTHDTPTFAAFWRGLDVGERVRLGRLPRSRAAAERERRRRLTRVVAAELKRRGWLRRDRPTTREALVGCLAFLADSPAETVLVQLEDLWLETHGQNVPGTSHERDNWRGRARMTLEQLWASRTILRVIRELDRRRKESGENAR